MSIPKPTPRVRGGATLALLAVGIVLAAIPGQAQTAAPDRWEATIQRFEEADREAFPEPGAVLFVGSSSIVRWDSLAEDFPSIRTLNRGFGGSRIGDVLHYADRVILPYDPSHVVVYVGENDLPAGRSAEEIFEDYQALVEIIRSAYPEIPVSCISIKPSPSRWEHADETRKANALVREWTAEDPLLNYIHVFDAMLGPDGLPPESLFVSDMLHMNEAGYAIWREIVAPWVEGADGP